MENEMLANDKFYTNAEAVKISGVSIVQIRNYFMIRGLPHPQGLWPAQVIDAYAEGRRRTKLALKIGYKTNRHLPKSFETICSNCGGFAVTWNEKTICENGHIT